MVWRDNGDSTKEGSAYGHPCLAQARRHVPWISASETHTKAWYQTQAVLRLSMGNFLFFAILVLIMIGVKDRNDRRDGWHIQLVNQELNNRVMELQKVQESIMTQLSEESHTARERIQNLEFDAEALISKNIETEKLVSESELQIDSLSESSRSSENKMQDLLKELKTHEQHKQVSQLHITLEEKEQLIVQYKEHITENRASLTAAEARLVEDKKQYDFMLESKQLKLSRHLKDISQRNDQNGNSDSEKSSTTEPISLVNDEYRKIFKVKADSKPGVRLCFLLLVLILMASNSAAHYQYNQLVQIYPPGYCGNQLSACVVIPPKRFTVHGLWPSNHSVYSIRCTNNYVPFNASLVTRDKQLHNRLLRNWPNLRRRNDLRFWSHEFEKHGRCMYDKLRGDQNAYFRLALDLKDGNNLHRFLANEGITPADKTRFYSLKDIERAIMYIWCMYYIFC